MLDSIGPAGTSPVDGDALAEPKSLDQAGSAEVARRLGVAKDELLARSIATLPVGQAESRSSLIEHYYRHVAPEDLLGRSTVEILGAVDSHLRTAQMRPQGTSLVHAFTPAVESDGWSVAHTVVEIVTDDMPFLVDSVAAAISGMDRAIHIVVHPQFAVSRDVAGQLHDIQPLDEDMVVPADLIIESWMHIEIDRETDGPDLAMIEREIQGVLRSVREAVEDWPRMVSRARRAAEELVANPPPTVDESEIAESVAFLQWLAEGNFTFLGFREYVLSEDGEYINATSGSGLGIMRSDRSASRAASKLSPEVRALARDPHVLILTKANSKSTVHRPTYLDYVGVKTFDSAGVVVGEHRFLGLYTATAYTTSVMSIPVLRRRAAQVLDDSGFRMEGHSYKDLVQLLESYPRDELFELETDELRVTALAVLHMRDRRQTRLFMRRDRYARFVSCLVYLPRDRYTTSVRHEMTRILKEQFGTDLVDYTARVSESMLARVHFVVRSTNGVALPQVDHDRLEGLLALATRSWEDDFIDALHYLADEEEAARLLREYVDVFPEAYKEDFDAGTAVEDIRRLDALSQLGEVALHLYEPFESGLGERRLKIFRRGESISLSRVLPVLQHMGVEVIDERPYDINLADGSTMWIYDFGLRLESSPMHDVSGLPSRFEDAFRAGWQGDAEVDELNALVVSAGLTWRQIIIIRALTRYLRQAGTSFSQFYIESCINANISISCMLVDLFEARFDPSRDHARDTVVAHVRAEIAKSLENVGSLDHDRILRSFLALIDATLRTNHFQTHGDGNAKPYVSMKFDPSLIPDLPAPRPKFEIWVYSPRVEGVHLRFGSVARGGLRWSDRREDFRTEVLGLVKAQMVKNAVIVPVGAKGGFFVKNSPDPVRDREAWLAEGIACYRVFISALLDITDNLVHGGVVPPPQVVRHDPDDTYLVVAADKGTATFSDIANEVAQSYGFWLGDAFASGGSVGYDHKVMGITARGAWESVKRHFRELQVNTQADDFTVVGVGDMSGDVFGNGMLLSEHIKLIAAFDHRHVFLDPSPDPVASSAERRRLFDLPRSSWADYDAALISDGGGVYARTAKSIPVSVAVRSALGIAADVEHLTPADLMRAILTAPVDLLWNGGIGTYVKSSRETHADVGDKANDAIRIDGQQLRCRVVGEGGNLGFTQLGRIEAAQAGVRLNTDAIDNSAGVDTSDHEVNIKILLDQAIRDGLLDGDQRNVLLAQMTDDVAQLVLRDNYVQNIVLGNARVQSSALLTVHQRFIRALEASGDLDRGLEYLPSDAEIEARHAALHGLTSPELAVLLAYAKITLTADLLETPLAEEPWFGGALRRYFPQQIADRFDAVLDSHPLRRQIVITGVVNDMVNRGGVSFAFRAGEETGAGPVEVARAYTVAREVFALPVFWSQVEALDNKVPTAAQCSLLLESRRLLDRATRWVIMSRGGRVDVEGEIDRFRSEVARLAPLVPQLLVGVEHERWVRRTDELQALGAPRELAAETASLLDVYGLLDVIEVARATNTDAYDVARLYFVLSERYEVDRMLVRITRLPRDDRWSALARAALRHDLYGALSGLTRSVIDSTPEMTEPTARIESWESLQSEGLARARATLDEIAELEQFDLATLSVALRTIRTLVRNGS